MLENTRKMNSVKELDCFPGPSQREIKRLISQVAMLSPVAECLLIRWIQQKGLWLELIAIGKFSLRL